MATRAISLLLAAAGGAGFLYRGQLQSLVHPTRTAITHQAPEGVYYLRASYTFKNSAGTVHWSPGQELRAAPNADTAADEVTLTDGRNTMAVSQADVTRDMDDAAALRRAGEDNRNSERLLAAQQQPTPDPDRLVAGHFRSGSLDAPAAPTNRPENIVSNVGGVPIIYPAYQTYQTVVVQQVGQPAIVRTIVVPQRVVTPRSVPPVTRSSPPPAVTRYQ